ncbi:hypothetical protein LUX57_32685 [Actinomadura madurae]|uniref:hypothetical protein n=1 Tax=Actinomadura madurae TaxID=1993 RepID=UPI0020D210FB|nr:hypothetical protein [Actinomadura madurae]MCP9969346.1 hypothetical protein [Actinomadura madurae]
MHEAAFTFTGCAAFVRAICSAVMNPSTHRTVVVPSSRCRSRLRTTWSSGSGSCPLGNSGPKAVPCVWLLIRPGSTTLPAASITRSARS